MKCFCIGGVAGPLDRSNHGLRLLLQLLNERGEPLRLLRIDLFGQQGRGCKSWIEVGIDECAHPSGQDQGGEEILVEPMPCGNVQALVRYGVVGANDREREGHAIRQFLFAQKSRSLIPVFD